MAADSERVSYQGRLRAIGAYLDNHGACGVSLVESDQGFALRYQRGRADLDGVGVDLSFAALDALQTELEWQRRAGRRTGADGADMGYQDLLRVLGYELERVEACYIVLDEVEDSIALSYLYSDPQKGYIWRKRLVRIGPEERRSATLAARGRRKPESSLLGRLLQMPAGSARAEAERLPPELEWEAGECEVYRTVLQVAWTGPGQDHIDTDLLLTNRRLVLHFQGGGTDKTLLAAVTGVSTHAVAGPLLKLHAVNVQRGGLHHLSLECRDPVHTAELAQKIEEARGAVRVGYKS